MTKKEKEEKVVDEFIEEMNKILIRINKEEKCQKDN